MNPNPGYNYIDGPVRSPNNISPEADTILEQDGWTNSVRLHPDYGQYADEEAGWNVAGKGAKYNANTQTTSSQTLKNLYPYNQNYRYFGYRGNDRYHALFADRSIQFMSEMITKGLQGVHPEGKPIIVPAQTIKSVADSVFNSSFSNANQMQQMTVNFIINHIKNEFETIEKNNKLSIWVTNYGIESGMSRLPNFQIKLNEKSRSHFSYLRY